MGTVLQAPPVTLQRLVQASPSPQEPSLGVQQHGVPKPCSQEGTRCPQAM